MEILAAAILAGAIAAVSGFGIGSILTPLLMLSMPTSDAVAIVALPHAWATCLRLVSLRHDIHRATFLQFGIASAVGGLAGAVLQSRLASPVLTALLACLLILAGGAELLRRPVRFPAVPAWKLVAGALSGAFGGLVGNQGGIRAAALLEFRLTPPQLVATATATALLVDAARVPVYLATRGDVVLEQLNLGLWMALGVTIGTFIGVPILGRIPARRYRSLLGGLLVGLGVLLLLL